MCADCLQNSRFPVINYGGAGPLAMVPGLQLLHLNCKGCRKKNALTSVNEQETNLLRVLTFALTRKKSYNLKKKKSKHFLAS